MKRNYIYLLLLGLFFGTTAFVVIRYNNKSQRPLYYHLKERKASLQDAAWIKTKESALKYLTVVERNPYDKKNALALAMLFIQEGRISGDHLYYDGAALHYINSVLQQEPQNFDALTLKSLIQLSQHHFSDGLATAQLAQKVNPYNAFVYGLLVDGYVETGNYKAAVENSDKMVSIRPDIRSYSRISYLRELFGDYKGSIEAMQMAAEAGIPGDETTEWSRVQLAKLYEETGDMAKAESIYHQSLSYRPNYAYAIAGLGRVALYKKEFTTAQAQYIKAAELVNDYAIKEQLAILYSLTGNKAKATETVKELIEGLSNDAKQGENDETIGHYADKELAYAYLLNKDFENALQHALAEYNRRPDNIDANETVAWVYYKKGAYQEALPYASEAIKTGCKNPLLLIHTGLVFAKSGQKEKAKAMLTEALQKKPNIDPDLANEAGEILKTM